MAVNKIVVGVGAAAAVAVGAAAFVLSGAVAPDTGAGTSTSLPNATNVPKNDQLSPVPPAEANRRATVNQSDAQRARDAGKDYQAPTVITGLGPADKGEEPPVPPQKPAPEVQERIIKETTQRTVYVTRQPVEQPVDDSAARAAIQAQIASLGSSDRGGAGNGGIAAMATNRYAKPPEEKKEAPAPKATGPNPATLRMVARTGDVIFARLDRGFNSDDPAAPIIVTLDDVVYDPATGTRNGPLTGMRLVGQISYSENQSAIAFNQIVTVSGQQFPIKAIAVSEQDARTGVATKVDNHTWSRYSGLFLSSLLQGLGQVGNQLVQNNRNYAVSDGVIVSNSNPVNYWQAGFAALQPLGNNLSTAARQQFNRPPTMTAPAGTGMGIVFLAPVVLPKGIR